MADVGGKRVVEVGVEVMSRYHGISHERRDSLKNTIVSLMKNGPHTMVDLLSSSNTDQMDYIVGAVRSLLLEKRIETRGVSGLFYLCENVPPVKEFSLEPTTHGTGSEGKIAVMADRAARGLPLFVAGDNPVCTVEPPGWNARGFGRVEADEEDLEGLSLH